MGPPVPQLRQAPIGVPRSVLQPVAAQTPSAKEQAPVSFDDSREEADDRSAGSPKPVRDQDEASDVMEQSGEHPRHEDTFPQPEASLEVIRGPSSDEVLEHLEQANAALDKASTLEEVKEIADMAAAAHLYAKRANRGKVAENKAAAYVCRALAKLGRMMPASREAKRLQKKGRPEKKVPKVPLSESTIEKPLTLAQIGIGKKQAAQTRKLAKFPVPEFEARLKGKLDKLELSRSS